MTINPSIIIIGKKLQKLRGIHCIQRYWLLKDSNFTTLKEHYYE